MPQPVSKRRNAAQILDDVAFRDHTGRYLSSLANFKHRAEDLLREIDTEAVVKHGPMSDVDEVLLRGVQEVVQRQKILDRAAEAFHAAE